MLGFVFLANEDIRQRRFNLLYALVVIFLNCGSNVMRWSKVTPKNTDSGTIWISCPNSSTVNVVFSISVLLQKHLVKTVSCDLKGSRVTNHLLHHHSSSSRARWIFWIDDATVFPVAQVSMSSAYCEAYTWLVSRSWAYGRVLLRAVTP